MQHSLDRFKRNTTLAFAPYGEVTQADRQRFASEVDSLDEPLSTVAARSAARETTRAVARGALLARTRDRGRGELVGFLLKRRIGRPPWLF